MHLQGVALCLLSLCILRKAFGPDPCKDHWHSFITLQSCVTQISIAKFGNSIIIDHKKRWENDVLCECIFVPVLSQTSQVVVRVEPSLYPQGERRFRWSPHVSPTAALFSPNWPGKQNSSYGPNMLTFSKQQFSKRRYSISLWDSSMFTAEARVYWDKDSYMTSFLTSQGQWGCSTLHVYALTTWNISTHNAV